MFDKVGEGAVSVAVPVLVLTVTLPLYIYLNNDAPILVLIKLGAIVKVPPEIVHVGVDSTS
jgi:hypothetical protein